MSVESGRLLPHNNPSKSRLGIPGTGWFINLTDRRPAFFFLLPAMLVLILLNIFPFIYSFLLSFHQWNLADRLATWKFVGLQNYATILFKDPFFWSAVRVTIVFIILSVAIELLLGLVIALLVAQETRGIDFVRTIIVIPMMITPVVVGLIWRFMYNTDLGMMNYLLGLLGIQGPVWLGDINYAMWAIIIADVWEWTPFMFLILLAALQSLPTEPIESALVDGASRLQMLRFIILPMIKPAIVIALLLRVIDSFKTFDLVYVLTMGGPGVSTQLLSLYTYKWGFKFFEMGYAAALSYVMLIAIDSVVTSGVGLSRITNEK
jgi:multiple sugar transport system permease protein